MKARRFPGNGQEWNLEALYLEKTWLIIKDQELV